MQDDSRGAVRALSGSLPLLALLLLLLPLTAGAAGPSRATPGGFDPDLLAGLRARSIGPAAMSGRVTVIEGVAADPRTLYVGAASGGVWKSVNGGLTWEPIFDDQPVASIGAIAVFQKSPDVVWVGTGEGNVRNSAAAGNGVYRSLDGGKTWTHLGLDATERIARIVLHPTDPDVAWVAALGREWGENPERGVYQTEDGGKSWKKLLYVDARTGAADLVIDPSNPQKLLAAMWQYRRWPWSFESGGPGSGLYASYDGGRTWKRRTEDDGLPKGELGRINLATSRSNPEIVYASVEAQKSALLRSSDGGRTWTTANQSPNIAPRPFYFATLEVDPQWPNRVYSLGFNVKVSDDSGKTFGNLAGAGKIHGDYHAMWIDPGDPRHFLIGDDGGLAVTYDRGLTAAFIADLPLAQYYHVAVDMETPYNVYGGLQDNGSWRGPSATWDVGGIPNSAWSVLGGGDGFGTLPDPADSSTGYSMAQNGYLFHWDLKTGELKDARPAPPDGVRLRFNWNAGIAVDPFAPGTVYYGSQFLHQSVDHGRTWTTISPDLTTNDPAWQKDRESGGITPDASGAETYTTILAIAPSPVARGLIWVGTDDGRVQVTRDGGKSWTSVEANVPGVPAHTWVPEIRASRFDAGTAFVVFDDHRRSNWTPYLYRTDDFGKTWRSLAGKELRGYALAIEQDPVDRDLLFLGTELGLWISEDGGGHWLRYKYGLPPVPVMGLAVHPRDRDLVIATHGRSLYVVDDIRPLSGLDAATLSEPLHLFSIAAAQQHWQRLPVGYYGHGDSYFQGENRPYGALITFSVSGPDVPLPDPERERARKDRERAAATQAAAAAKAAAAKRGEEQAGETAARGKTATEKTAAAEPAGAEKTAAAPAAPIAPAAPAAEEKTTAAKQAEEKKAPEPPKAQIEVADASGKTIRHWKTAVKLGINRVAWGLERDDWKEAPPGPDQPPQEDPAGPEVPPGTYTVTVKFHGHEGRNTVQVLADPRSPNRGADWQQRWAAISRTGALQEAAAEAIERIGRIRADVESAVAKAKAAATAEKRRQDAEKRQPGAETSPQSAGSTQQGAGATPQGAGATPQGATSPASAGSTRQGAGRSEAAAKDEDEEPSPLAGAAEKLGKRLDELETRLWQRPDAKGIHAPDDVAGQIGLTMGALTGQWDPPSATQLETLRQTADQLDKFLADFNRFCATDLAAFRRQVVEAKVGLLPEEPPIAVARP
ncbi:MAG TPA: hypothetical protein VJA16_05570 [Thermoanaerobaculia bacterium]